MARSITWATALVVLCLAPPRAVWADDASGVGGAEASNASVSAEQRFHEGHALLKDKRYAEACAKFAQSQRLDPASGTLLALAYCQELSALFASAWESYQAAAQLAEREGHTDRQSAASERVQVLGARVSKLTVQVPPELLNLAGFRLLRDGVEIERASFGLALPTDGGPHMFHASAPGRVPWTSTVTLLAERDQKILVLPVLDLERPVPSNEPPVGPQKKALPAPTPLPTENSEQGSQVTLRRASLGFAIASVVGLGVGTGFALSARSKNDQSNANGLCDSTGCSPEGVELRNSALSAARAATWSFVAGGALAACSVTLFLTANASRTPAKAAARVQGNLSLGAPSVSLVGSF